MSAKAISKFCMGAMAVYALVVSVLWVSITEIMFVSDYEGVTGQPLSEALAAGLKSAELWLATKRLVGILLLAASVLMVFVVYGAFNQGEKWAWYGLLVAGLITWGSLIGYKAAIGYFRLSGSSMTFIIGAVLYVIGIAFSAKWILGAEGG